MPQGLAAGTLRWESGGGGGGRGGGGGLQSPRGARGGRGGRGARGRGRGAARKATSSAASAQSASPAARHLGSEAVWPFPVVVPPEALGYVHGGGSPQARAQAPTPAAQAGAAQAGAAQAGARRAGAARATSPRAVPDPVVAGATVQLKRTPDKRGWASRHLAVLVRRVHGDGTFDAEPPSDEEDVAPWRLEAEPLHNIERVLSRPAKRAAAQRPPAAEVPPVAAPPSIDAQVEAEIEAPAVTPAVTPAVGRVASFLAAGAAFFPAAFAAPPAPPAPTAPLTPLKALEALEARIGLPPQTGPASPRLEQLELIMDCSDTTSLSFAGAHSPRPRPAPRGARTAAYS